MASKKKQVVVEDVPAVRVILIAAIAANGVIGDKGTLPWHIPEDLKLFKELTAGTPLVMGRRTFESMPAKVWLDRTPFVLTRTPMDVHLPDSVMTQAHLVSADDLDKLIQAAKDASQTGKVFIIGGASIYETALGLRGGTRYASEVRVDEVIITHLHQSYVGDTEFPMLGLFGFQADEQIATNDKFRTVRYLRSGVCANPVPFC